MTTGESSRGFLGADLRQIEWREIEAAGAAYGFANSVLQTIVREFLRCIRFELGGESDVIGSVFRLFGFSRYVVR